MAGSKDSCEARGAHTQTELKAFHGELRALAQAACTYPLNYSLGTYELLFESKNDVVVLVDCLGESIAEMQSAA